MSYKSPYSLVVQVEQLLVIGERCNEVIPIPWSQSLHPVGSSAGVQLVPNGVVVQVGLLKIHYPGLVVYYKSRSLVMVTIHVINTVSWIQIVIRRHGGSYVGDARRPGHVLGVVKHLELVEMRVPKELRSDGALIPRDNAVIVPGPDLDAVRMTRWNVADDVDLLIGELGTLEFVDEPLQLSGWVRGVQKEPPVLIIAVVHVEGDDTETGANEDRVKGSSAHRVADTSWQPTTPLYVQFVVQPGDGLVHLLHVRWGETVHWGRLMVTQGRKDGHSWE